MLYLASQSPRRRDLLALLVADFGVLDVDIPEARDATEPAQDYVRRVAREKAGAGLLRVTGNATASVLAADTEVIVDDAVLGKPANADAAAAMLRRLSGRTHQVASCVWLVDAGREVQALSLSEVTFAHLDPRQIGAYVAGGEWRGKAGGYAIQGRAQAFIAHLSGSYSGVMGLPLYETAGLLHQFGIATAVAEPDVDAA